MGKNNIQLYAFAKSFLGRGGSIFRQFCGLPSNAAWCAAFVSYIFAKGNDASLFYGGKKVVYVPSAEKWLFANCANIPIDLAMPMDVLTFDWNNNGVPDHIGFVRERKSDTEVYTIEGNTSGGIVAQRTRPAKYISGCFRIGFVPSSSWSADKALSIDGECGYNTIAVLQKVLKKKGCYSDKIDAILGKNTVKGIQKLCGVAQDGSWGTKTSKALQRYLGVSADGWFGVNSVKAMQKWLNKQNSSTPSTVKPDPLQKWYDAMTTQFNWSKNQRYEFNEHPTVANSKEEGTCITFPAVSLQRLGLLPSGKYFYLYPKTMRIAGNGADYIKSHPETFILWYPQKTIKELGSIIHKGDIIGFGEPAYHTMVYMGKNSKGEPIFNSMGHQKILGGTYSYYANRKINMLVRIKKIK